MKLRKTMLFVSALTLFSAPITNVFAQNQSFEWTPRSIEQVKEDLLKEGNQLKYTIQYGDTLSVIAEALNIDLHLIASINEITDLNLIYPDSVLTTTYNRQDQAQSIRVEVQDENQETAIVAQVNIEEGQIVLEDQVLDIPQETQEYVTPLVPEWVETTSQAVTEGQTTQVSEWVETTSSAEETSLPTVTETTVSEWLLEETSQVTEPAQTEEVSVETDEDLVDEWLPETTTQMSLEVLETETSVETTEEFVESTEVAPIEETTETELVIEETEATSLEVIEDLAPIVNEPGLKPHVAAFKDLVGNMFGITSFSTYRPGDPGDHGKGLAVDFMVDVNSPIGDQIAQYAISQIGTGKVSYVIWKQQIYGDWNMAWTMMEDRGGVTANHFDHVHVSFYE